MDGSSPAGRIAWKIQNKGCAVRLRRLSRSDGPNPLINPAECGELHLDGAAAIGATTLNLRSDLCRGRLVAGDRLVLPTEKVIVVAETASRPGRPAGFSAVPVAAPLTAAVVDGTTVQVEWSADLATYAVISAFPRRLVDGERIRSRDLSVLLPAFGLPEPLTGWKLVVGDRAYGIMDAYPAFDGSEIVTWNVQAR